MSKIKNFKGHGKSFFVRRIKIINDKNGFIDCYQLVGQKEMFEEGKALQRTISGSGDIARKEIQIVETKIMGNDPEALCEHCKIRKQFHACDKRLCSDCDGDLNVEAGFDAYIHRND